MKTTLAYLIASILVLIVACILLWYLGPRAKTTYACSVCGKLKDTKEILGVEYHAEIKSEELGDWYDEKELRQHECEWKSVSSYTQSWGGRGEQTDNFGGFLYPLVELKRIEPLVDEKKFKKLTKLYYEVHHDEEKCKLFMTKCAEITP